MLERELLVRRALSLPGVLPLTFGKPVNDPLSLGDSDAVRFCSRAAQGSRRKSSDTLPEHPVYANVAIPTDRAEEEWRLRIDIQWTTDFGISNSISRARWRASCQSSRHLDSGERAAMRRCFGALLHNPVSLFTSFLGD